MSDSKSEVLDIIAEQTGIAREELQLDRTLASFQIDSLDILRVVVAVEERFGLMLPEEAAAQVLSEDASLGSLVKLAVDSISKS